MDVINITLPFNVDNIFEGLAEASGIITLDKFGITMQFQVRDSLFGIISGDKKNITLTFSELSDLEFNKGRFWSTPTLTINSHLYLADKGLPNVHANSIVLKIDKKNADKATLLASKANLSISEMQLRKMENM